MDDNMFCGVGPVPKGKIRGTAEYCASKHQIRYYGLVKIDPKLLEKIEKKKRNLLTEQIKLKKIEDKAKILVKESGKIKAIISNDKSKDSEIAKAEKRLVEIKKIRDKLLEQLNNQKSIVNEVKKQQQQDEKDKIKQKQEKDKVKQKQKKLAQKEKIK